MEGRGRDEEEVKKESWAVKEGKEDEEGSGRGRLRDGAKKESGGLVGSEAGQKEVAGGGLGGGIIRRRLRCREQGHSLGRDSLAAEFGSGV
ncbi:hypothetical protein Bca52824_010030 [Brassica carinata]|uniref:Uncharacterized protein n=1 Tax=Brassica carinata TaxID=52824 RepID=A0A8X7WDF4_BRACI|nr:hypothetical protein Bca52824_010030 [Brassica carinata]